VRPSTARRSPFVSLSSLHFLLLRTKACLLQLANGGDELINYVADRHNDTIVVVTAPGPIDFSDFADHPNVSAILFTYFPVVEGGAAMASIIHGDVNPSGKLPFTVAANVSDYDAGTLFNGTVDIDPVTNFTEGDFIDYRYFDEKNITPLYEFGFGLSYTSCVVFLPFSHLLHLSILLFLHFLLPLIFTLSSPLFAPPCRNRIDPLPFLAASPSRTSRSRRTRRATKRSSARRMRSSLSLGRRPRVFTITPTPSRRPSRTRAQSTELRSLRCAFTSLPFSSGFFPLTCISIQLYISWPSSTPRKMPVRQLRGFEKPFLKAGASKTVSFALRNKDLAYYSTVLGGWTIPEGEFTVSVGSSSRKLPLVGKISV
jgi:hypothetical protein